MLAMCASMAFVFCLAAFTARAQDSIVVVDLNENVRIEMRRVDGGTFKMGYAGGGDVKHSYESCRPVHEVSVDSYYIGVYEVTQAQWEAVTGERPSWFGGNDSLPVEQVSWEDAQRFVALLAQMTGKRFRLPTEAEWEYAARGGSRSKGLPFAGCNRGQLEHYGWFCVQSHGHTYPVGRLLPNELGLYDMCGNVAEWCVDWKGDYTEGQSENNPRGPREGDSRIVRGGHWGSTSWGCTVFDRGWYVPTGKTEYYGLRLAMDEEGEKDED